MLAPPPQTQGGLAVLPLAPLKNRSIAARLGKVSSLTLGELDAQTPLGLEMSVRWRSNGLESLRRRWPWWIPVRTPGGCSPVASAARTRQPLRRLCRCGNGSSGDCRPRLAQVVAPVAARPALQRGVAGATALPGRSGLLGFASTPCPRRFIIRLGLCRCVRLAVSPHVCGFWHCWRSDRPVRPGLGRQVGTPRFVLALRLRRCHRQCANARVQRPNSIHPCRRVYDPARPEGQFCILNSHPLAKLPPRSAGQGPLPPRLSRRR